MSPAQASNTNKLTIQEEWLVSEKDSALETAVVYENETSNQCGHALHMVPLMDYLEKASGSKKAACPVCQAPMEFICDGMVKTLQQEATSSGGKSETINQSTTAIEADNNNKIVTFKYRNHLYRLAVMRGSSNVLPVPSFVNAWCLWMWKTVLHLMGENTTVTAQERISHVLRMDMHGGMRVGIYVFHI